MKIDALDDLQLGTSLLNPFRIGAGSLFKRLQGGLFGRLQRLLQRRLHPRAEIRLVASGTSNASAS